MSFAAGFSDNQYQNSSRILPQSSLQYFLILSMYAPGPSLSHWIILGLAGTCTQLTFSGWASINGTAFGLLANKAQSILSLFSDNKRMAAGCGFADKYPKCKFSSL